MTKNVTSLPQKLFKDTLERLIDTLALEEQPGENGGAYRMLESKLPMAKGVIGNMRLFKGAPLSRVVTISLTVPAIHLDSHMLFAFTPSTSAIPHFTLDSVKAGEHFAFHLDLIPRIDLGCNLAYMQEVFNPLTEAFEQGSVIEGLSKAHLSPMQVAIMSPWMLAHRASEQAFEQIHNVVNNYQDHWFALLNKGISADVLTGVSSEQLIERDKKNKQIIFSPEVDPVWERITAMIGEQAVAEQRALLIGDDENG